MGMSRSAYHYRPKDKKEKEKRDRDLCKKIKAVCYRFPFYGYRRVTAALKRKRVVINHKKVLKLMKEMGIQVKKRKRYTRTTNSCHNLKGIPQSHQEPFYREDESGVVLRYYLYRHKVRLCVSGSDPRCLQPKSGRLCHSQVTGSRDGPGNKKYL